MAMTLGGNKVSDESAKALASREVAHRGLYRDLAMGPCKRVAVAVCIATLAWSQQRTAHRGLYRDLAMEQCRGVAMEVFTGTCHGSLYGDLAMEPCEELP